MAVSRTRLCELLLAQSTKKHYIEYQIYLSNHIAHGMIALHHLGASEERINHFVDWYKSRLESPEPYTAEEVDDVATICGKRRGFYSVLEHYEKLLQESGTMDELIKAEFPKLSLGMQCSALHGLIHLGYGYNAGSERIICEGLAYLHHSYTPIIFTASLPQNDIKHFGHGSKDIVEVLEAVRNDTWFDKCFQDNYQDVADRIKRSGFQNRLATLSEFAGDKLMEYAHAIRGPEFLEGDINMDKLEKLSDWLLNKAITVHCLSSTVNDFFLVHGVTSAWSLRQFISVLSCEDALVALREFTWILLGTYITQTSPALTGTIDNNLAVTQEKWDGVIQKGVNADVDEHVYKIVQVCYGLWKDGKYPDMAPTYFTAATLTVENDLAYVKYPQQKKVEDFTGGTLQGSV